MPTRRGWVAVGVVVFAAAASGAWLAPPEQVRSLAVTARNAIAGTLGAVPDPVLLGAGLVVGTLLSLSVLWVFARWLYRCWRRFGGRLWRAVDFVWPGDPLVKFVTGVTAFILVTVVIIGALPTVAEFGGEDTRGATDYAQRLSDRAPDSDWESVVEGDTVGMGPACSDQQVSGPDRDGDGLPDRWERAGETPDGAPLPGADPDHKDLYVQFNHGTNVEGLTATERRQLRVAWARMSVENPDGSSGIRLHLTDGGSLGEPVTGTDSEGTREYYDAARMGPRLCVYHQTVYGHLESDEAVGRGATPGYATVVDGRRYDAYEGNVSLRVALTTHELLHNVAGRVDGRPHTTEGWLAFGPDDSSLSAATARELNETGLFGPVR